MEWTRLNILSSPLVDVPPSLFPTKKILLKNPPAWCSGCCMATFFNMFSISTCIRSTCSLPMCDIWGALLSVGLFRKGILSPFPISLFSGSFVSISHASKKCFNLHASGKFGTFLAENKIFIHGWTFLRSSIGIIRGNNMLNKVSFVFVFTLESTASTSC